MVPEIQTHRAVERITRWWIGGAFSQGVVRLQYKKIDWTIVDNAEGCQKETYLRV